MQIILLQDTMNLILMPMDQENRIAFVNQFEMRKIGDILYFITNNKDDE